MNPKQPLPSVPSITPREIYYILYRHKWLAIILLTVTILTTLVLYNLWPVPYSSQAMLMIKYVQNDKPPEGPKSESQMSSGAIPGESVINSELNILRSYDLASNVVSSLGAQRILARAGGGTNATVAAGKILQNFAATADKSDVVELKFTYPDVEMVQPILNQLIEAYRLKHREVHDLDSVNFLQEHKDEVNGRIKDIDRQLLDLKHEANIDSSIVDSEKSSSDLHSRILGEKLEAQAEYAGYEATIVELKKLVPPSAVTASTNATGSNAPVIPSGKVADYQKVCQLLTTLQASEQDLLQKYTTNNSQVVAKQGEVDRAEQRKDDLEAKYPGLTLMKPPESRGPATAAGGQIDPQIALNEEVIKADALMAKIQALDRQLSQTQTNQTLMSSLEGQITQLQREKEINYAEFEFYSRKLEEERVKETLQGTANISLVEQPTPPTKEVKKFDKILLGILVGGIALAFALPFGIELYLDRTLKRPLDVQSRLGLPFFISIPRMNGNGKSIKKSRKVALLAPRNGHGSPPANEEPPTPDQPNGNGHLALWEHHLDLQPFYDTLRDRLMTYFEMINLTHKPKLVAVTSCGQGAGVTSTAAGLASSLSETGEGNVLLVNMNGREGEAHHFYKGKLNCALEDMFDEGTRVNGMVQDNLYVAKEQAEDDRLPRVLPKRFSHLLPKMKASDFDYIIFDMPPVSQISITPRLARFMDMVLLVIDSGKTDRDVAARAAAVLSESKTNVGVVLNKTRTYGPRRNQHEI